MICLRYCFWHIIISSLGVTKVSKYRGIIFTFWQRPVLTHLHLSTRMNVVWKLVEIVDIWLEDIPMTFQAYATTKIQECESVELGAARLSFRYRLLTEIRKNISAIEIHIFFSSNYSFYSKFSMLNDNIWLLYRLNGTTQKSMKICSIHPAFLCITPKIFAAMT